MARLNKDMSKLKEKVDKAKPSTKKAYDDAMKAYYKQKAMFETADSLISKAGAGEKAANEQVDKVKFTREWSKEDKAEVAAQVEKYIDMVDDKETGSMLLQKLEEDAQFQVNLLKRKMKKDDSDANKFEYYNALKEYDVVKE